MDLYEFYSTRWMIGDVDGLIKKGFTTNQKNCKRLLQIIHMPAFHQPIVNWEIFRVENGRANEYFMVKTFWDGDEDAKKMGILRSDSARIGISLGKKPAEIEPTIVNKKYGLQNEFVENIIDELIKIKISPFPSMCPMGCDGTSYRLALGDSINYLDIGWWENGPGNWSELTTFINETLSIFNKISDANT